jgi:light-regulated signal transduction histidine kinase (bacteriophytochrome)
MSPLHTSSSRIVIVDGSELVVTTARAASARARQLEHEALRRHVRRQRSELEHVRKDFESFSYSVAHDLRAPLRAVEAFATVLREDFGPQLPEEAQTLLSDVTDGARRLEQLTQDLLQFSRVSRQPLTMTTVDVRSLVLESVERLRAAGSFREVELRVGELPAAHGDPVLLATVWTNLIANAFKFTGRTPHPIVEIGCGEEHGVRFYFVRDNGAGFDMQYAIRLFGMFQRFHAESQFEGTGAGLAIARSIIERHGGRIWAEGAPDLGATFRFTLGAERS